MISSRARLAVAGTLVVVGAAVPATARAAYVPTTSPQVTCNDSTKTVVVSGFSPTSSVTVSVKGATQTVTTDASGTAGIPVAGKDLSGSTLTATGPTPPSDTSATVSYTVPAGQCALPAPAPSPSDVVASDTPTTSASTAPTSSASAEPTESTASDSPSSAPLVSKSAEQSPAALPAHGALAHTGGGNALALGGVGALLLLLGAGTALLAARRRRA
ncbi:hypothetical protein EV189_2827 [Motilibacter rhizosphaerae]|uniref:Gram-positive cocci surface proteins LPxTG domain-containing protein n=1 Tax=Motilibacter rhizosphaerae TaxID=598652 RepID=A0A4Q7NQL8_9ACTN|nr:hypothetical protein [Motilibacter rhizosphaerae]RZS87398.1 hypothetical protein EV189_2827 [Motilibacter rhizosphaerae]